MPHGPVFIFQGWNTEVTGLDHNLQTREITSVVGGGKNGEHQEEGETRATSEPKSFLCEMVLPSQNGSLPAVK